MAFGRGMPPGRAKMKAPVEAAKPKPKRGKAAKAQTQTDTRKISDNRADAKYTMPAATKSNGEDNRAVSAMSAKSPIDEL